MNQRARVPTVSNFEFVVRPKSRVQQPDADLIRVGLLWIWVSFLFASLFVCVLSRQRGKSEHALDVIHRTIRTASGSNTRMHAVGVNLSGSMSGAH